MSIELSRERDIGDSVSLSRYMYSRVVMLSLFEEKEGIIIELILYIRERQARRYGVVDRKRTEDEMKE